MTEAEIIILILSIILSAFFSGMEIAYVSSNKLRLELASKSKGLTARILRLFNNNSSRYISTMLVGNNVVLVIYGIFMAALLEPPIHRLLTNETLVLLLQTIISTLIILVFAEFLPKAIFRIFNNGALKTFAFPLAFFYFLFYPIVGFTVWLTNIFFRIFTKSKIDDSVKANAFGKIDIEEILEKSKSTGRSRTKQELQILKNAMDFSQIKLRECIVPRNNIVALPIDTDIATVKAKFIETGHSNILIYRNSVDEIDGYINVKDIFKRPQKLRNVMRQVSIVPETMSAKRLFEDLIAKRRSLAVVVDEFGSTGGIVTIEDIMEEIFGEFEDEHDAPEVGVQINKDGNYIIPGHVDLHDLNDEYGLNLSTSDEYNTIAGYVLFFNGDFPQENDVISITDNGVTRKFKILKVAGTKIDRIMLFKDTISAGSF